MQILDVDFPPAGWDGSTCGFQSSRNFIHTFLTCLQEEIHVFILSVAFPYAIRYIFSNHQEIPYAFVQYSLLLFTRSTPRCKVLIHVFKPSGLLSWCGQEIRPWSLKCVHSHGNLGKLWETNPTKNVQVQKFRDWPMHKFHWIFQQVSDYCRVFTLVFKKIDSMRWWAQKSNPSKEAVMWNFVKTSWSWSRKKVLQGGWGGCSVSYNWNASTSWKKDGNISPSSIVFKHQKRYLPGFYPTVWDFQLYQIFRLQTFVGKHSQFKNGGGLVALFELVQVEGQLLLSNLNCVWCVAHIPVSQCNREKLRYVTCYVASIGSGILPTLVHQY